MGANLGTEFPHIPVCVHDIYLPHPFESIDPSSLTSLMNHSWPSFKGFVRTVRAAPAIAAHVCGCQIAGREIREAPRRVVDLGALPVPKERAGVLFLSKRSSECSNQTKAIRVIETAEDASLGRAETVMLGQRAILANRFDVRVA